MKRPLLGIVAGIFGLVSLSVSAQDQLTGVIRDVIDGDTFWLHTDSQGSVKIRLWGVDSAERGTAEGEAAALWAIDEWTGLSVNCITHGTSYDRIVAVCYDAGSAALSDIAWSGIHAGHLKDWPQYSGGYYGGK